MTKGDAKFEITTIFTFEHRKNRETILQSGVGKEVLEDVESPFGKRLDDGVTCASVCASVCACLFAVVRTGPAVGGSCLGTGWHRVRIPTPP